jgi:hypothetical protein
MAPDLWGEKLGAPRFLPYRSGSSHTLLAASPFRLLAPFPRACPARRDLLDHFGQKVVFGFLDPGV